MMAKKITALKCPHCGSTHKHLIEKDRYQCKSCDSEYMFDSGDVNITVNHRHTIESSSDHSFLNISRSGFVLIAIVLTTILVVSYNLLSTNTDHQNYRSVSQQAKSTRAQPVASVNLGENISIGISAEGVSQIKNLVTKPFSAQNKQLDTCFVYTGICHKIFMNRMVFLVGKKGLNISGMNKAVLEKLAEQKKLATLVSWLDLSMDDLLASGMSPRQAKKALEKIQLAPQQSFQDWMSGIYQFNFPSQINQYTWSDIQSWSMSDWQTLMELSEVKAQPYYQLTHSEEMNQLVDELQKYSVSGFDSATLNDQ